MWQTAYLQSQGRGSPILHLLESKEKQPDESSGPNTGENLLEGSLKWLPKGIIYLLI